MLVMGDERAVRLLVVDDDARVLTAVNRAMARICEVFPCPTADDALRTADELGADLGCAAVDVNLGRGADGIEVLAALRARSPGLPALVFTGEWTIDAAAWARYARLCPVPWTARKPDVLGDFKRVVALTPIAWLLGGAYSKQVIEAVLDEADDHDLTPRERQVFALVVRDDTTEVIARKLGIKPSSVETHLAGLRAKLGPGSLREIRRAILDRAARAALVDEIAPSPPTGEIGPPLPRP
jgi:FixJ family two-component response regulator